jgi:hypothetical protein
MAGTMDVTTDVGTSSRRAINAAGNDVDVMWASSSKRVRSGMISIFP